LHNVPLIRVTTIRISVNFRLSSHQAHNDDYERQSAELAELLLFMFMLMLLSLEFFFILLLVLLLQLLL